MVTKQWNNAPLATDVQGDYVRRCAIVVVSVSSLKFASFQLVVCWGEDSPFLIVGFFLPPKNTGTARLAILNQKTTRN